MLVTATAANPVPDRATVLGVPESDAGVVDHILRRVGVPEPIETLCAPVLFDQGGEAFGIGEWSHDPQFEQERVDEVETVLDALAGVVEQVLDEIDRPRLSAGAGTGTEFGRHEAHCWLTATMSE